MDYQEALNDVDGATVLSIEDLGLGEVPSEDHECLRVYQTYFRTNREDITLEFRNSSNGYYGGHLVYCGATPANDNRRAS